MMKVEAIVRPESLQTIIDRLDELGHSGITKTEVEGHGRQKGIVEQFRGKEYRLTFIPKVKIEIVVKDKDVEKVIDAIAESAYTGQIGDGKIFISEVKDAIRVRTRERGDITL
ncbi:MAG: P-II family nitrogen regulator [Fusobacteriaceae bacterium]|jgi:nitrogen regulatory protein P-II 1|nr:P-II family nitrogen regulator [Fusobacteriaceae bacterium]MBP6468359.1 P-II family nitrogen regulator [Fusobacteriaceae bacterium]MBU9918799.1 P-II family nitrogen regulator [Fusobacteriaceae bacterium]